MEERRARGCRCGEAFRWSKSDSVFHFASVGGGSGSGGGGSGGGGGGGGVLAWKY